MLSKEVTAMTPQPEGNIMPSGDAKTSELKADIARLWETMAELQEQLPKPEATTQAITTWVRKPTRNIIHTVCLGPESGLPHTEYSSLCGWRFAAKNAAYEIIQDLPETHQFTTCGKCIPDFDYESSESDEDEE